MIPLIETIEIKTDASGWYGLAAIASFAAAAVVLMVGIGF